MQALKYWGRVVVDAWKSTSLLATSKVITTVLIAIVGHMGQYELGIRKLPDSVKLIVITIVAYAAVCALSFAWNFVMAPVRLDAAQSKKIGDLNRPDPEERGRQDAIIAKLRQLYIRSGNVNTENADAMLAGIAPLPKEWVEKELEKIGEVFRRPIYV